jgi:hypothetical protein
MKCNKVILSLTVCTSLILTVGCSNPTQSVTETQVDPVASVEKEKYVHFDKTYEIEYSVTGKDIKKIDGADNAAVAELMSGPTAGVVKDPKEENVFWIYKDSTERANVVDLIKTKHNLPKLSKKLAKTTHSYYDVVLYQHSNYGGATFTIYVNVPSCSDYGWNDAASSLKLYNADVTLYENSNYGGHSITFVCDMEASVGGTYAYSFGEYPSLGSYTMISRWYWTDISWNDQVSSVAIWPY